MENAAKRIRKARRQGLASRPRTASPRVRFDAPSAQRSGEGDMKPNRPRKTKVTRRKAKRQAKAPSRSGRR